MHGWDVAGVVRTAAADGSGPPEGARVVGRGQRCLGAARRSSDLRARRAAGRRVVRGASTLPIAGITAVQVLDVGGTCSAAACSLPAPPVGWRLRGPARPSGGRSRHGGRPRPAARRRPARAGRRRRDHRACPRRRSLRRHPRVRGWPEPERRPPARRSGGRRGLIRHFLRRADHVRCLALLQQSGARLQGYRIFEELRRHDATRALRLLADEVAAGRLDPLISLTTSWREADPGPRALLERRVRGKAVLTID